MMSTENSKTKDEPGVGLLPPGYVAQRGGAALRLVPTRFHAPTLPNKCPSCGALPDVPCRWKSGRMGHRPEVHEKRLAAHKAAEQDSVQPHRAAEHEWEAK
jgi:hypothetical protein